MAWPQWDDCFPPKQALCLDVFKIQFGTEFSNLDRTSLLQCERNQKRIRSAFQAGAQRSICGSSLSELAAKALHFLFLFEKVTFRLPWLKISLILAINLLLSSPLIQHMTVAKMSVYKRMKLACCFDCGRSERDCSCMSSSVHNNMDSLQRAFPLSSVSIHDCSTSLRACKFDRQTTCRSVSVTCVSVRVRKCVRVCAVFHVPCLFRSSIISVYVAYWLVY